LLLQRGSPVVTVLLMETATACLAHRIEPMLPRREATTIACHCCGFPLSSSANNHAVTANVGPADPRITVCVACSAFGGSCLPVQALCRPTPSLCIASSSSAVVICFFVQSRTATRPPSQIQVVQPPPSSSHHRLRATHYYGAGVV
jgi:hypothetical protein